MILTIKAGAGIERAEEELLLDPARFERLWPLTAGRRVEKGATGSPPPAGS